MSESNQFGSFIDPPDDLSQLRRIQRADVQALAETVNRLTPEDLNGKKLVLLVATGGTLAMTTNEQGVRLPAFNWQEVFKPAESLLRGRFDIRGINAYCIDSSQMDYGHVREVAIAMTYLWKNVKVPFLGFLVTHGTDTMAFTGAALSLMTGQGLPFSVVLTGAQRPLNDPLSDAPLNLRNALCILEALHEHNMAEVLIAMGDRAMLATSAEKVDDSAANAFDAPRHCFVAKFDRLNYPLPLAGWLNQRRNIPFQPTIWKGDNANTLIIKSTMGLNPAMIGRQVQDPDVHAVILFSYGAGTVHHDVLTAVLDQAKNKEIPVFIVNPVNADYKAEYESAAKAIQLGAIPLNMTLSSALAKIEIGLRKFPDDLSGLSRFMRENYVGEVPTERSSISARRISATPVTPNP